MLIKINITRINRVVIKLIGEDQFVLCTQEKPFLKKQNFNETQYSIFIKHEVPAKVNLNAEIHRQTPWCSCDQEPEKEQYLAEVL